MEVKFLEKLPASEAFYNLYESTGWNKRFQFTEKELSQAISNSWFVLTAYDNEKLIGFGRIISDGVYQTLIGDLIIHPDYQGRGLGSTLLTKLEAHCKNNGIRWIQLTSAEGKRGFYKKHGYSERPADGPGMEKDL